MVRVVGHRGAAGHAPENTLPGFNRAIELGVDVIEFDVRETADGVLVIIHDERVDQVTDGIGAVNELTVDELRTLDAGDGAKIPALNETLDLLADHDVDLRVEPKELGLSEQILAAIEERGLLDRTTFVSFDPQAIKEIADAAAPTSITTSLMTGDPDGAFFDAAERLGCLLVGINHEAADQRIVDTAHDRGFDVDLWAPNDPAEIEAVLTLGPDVVWSDYPDRVLARL